MDNYTNEATQEIPEHLSSAYVEAVQNAEAWRKIAEELQEKIIALNPEAHAYTVHGRKVITYRPTKRTQEVRLRNAYPELTEAYVAPKVTYTFDVKAFGQDHPEILSRFVSRQFRRAE